MFMFFLWMKLNNVLSISGPMSHKQYIELHEDSPGISLCTYCTSDEPLTDCYPRDAVTDDNHLKSKHKQAIQCQHCNSDYLLREGPYHSPLLTLKYQFNLNQPITTRRSLIHYLTPKHCTLPLLDHIISFSRQSQWTHLGILYNARGQFSGRMTQNFSIFVFG